MIAQKIKLTKITTTDTCYVGLQLYSEGKNKLYHVVTIPFLHAYRNGKSTRR